MGWIRHSRRRKQFCRPALQATTCGFRHLFPASNWHSAMPAMFGAYAGACLVRFRQKSPNQTCFSIEGLFWVLFTPVRIGMPQLSAAIVFAPSWFIYWRSMLYPLMRHWSSLALPENQQKMMCGVNPHKGPKLANIRFTRFRTQPPKYTNQTHLAPAILRETSEETSYQTAFAVPIFVHCSASSHHRPSRCSQRVVRAGARVDREVYLGTGT